MLLRDASDGMKLLHDPGRAGRHPGDRPHPRAGRAVLHADPGRSRRRDRQGRAAARRRGAGLGAALQRGRRRVLFRRRQPQQALARPRPRPARGPRRAAADARARGRAGRELQAGGDGEMGPGLRRGAAAALSAPGPLPHHRLWRRRPDGRLSGLRRGGAGDGRHVLDQRHAGERADPDRHPAGRPRHRAVRRDRGADGAARAWRARARASSST